MKALIVINSYVKLESQLSQASRFKEELELKNVKVDTIKSIDALTYINSDRLETKLPKYDFVIYLDKDKYVIKMLEKLGYKVFNCSKALIDCDDKMLTHIELSNNGINMPKSIPASLCYTNGSKIDSDYLDYLINTLGLPMVVKESYGSLGKEVYLVKTKKELEELSNKLIYKPHLYQEFIQESSGRDIRVIVIGGKVIASMERKSEKDFRSNIGLGGKGSKFELSKDCCMLCEKVSKVLNLDYCGIDLLVGKDNKALVCEVNSNAFFNEVEKISGVNVAKVYIEYILGRI